MNHDNDLKPISWDEFTADYDYDLDLIAYDTRQVLRGNVYPEAAARGCGDIESPIFDAIASHYLMWFFRSED